MASTKEISRRIKSVTSTKKITKAMEMVAASKMRKAIDAVLKTRTYANLSWETVLHLAKAAQSRNESTHPLLKKRQHINKVAIILITSNRGLCGGYNAAVIAKAKESIDAEKRAAMAELQASVADLSIAVAGKVIGKSMTVEDHAELIRQAMAEVGGLNG